MSAAVKEQKQCFFCTGNMKAIDYKNAETLKRFLDPYGRIMPKKYTSVCAFHQRKLARAIKRARMIALLPFVAA